MWKREQTSLRQRILTLLSEAREREDWSPGARSRALYDALCHLRSAVPRLSPRTCDATARLQVGTVTTDRR